MTDIAEPQNPLEQVRQAFERAQVDAPFDPTAAALGTADGEGRPSVRFVLVKHFRDDGVTFFSNFSSRKAQQLSDNDRAAITLYWPWIEQQVRLEGQVEHLSAAESDAYFRTRPRISQLGAWASRQSAPLSGRAELLDEVEKVKQRFHDREVPRPNFWGGFLLRARRVEIWKAGEYRLHDRMVFTHDGARWHAGRLYP